MPTRTYEAAWASLRVVSRPTSFLFTQAFFLRLLGLVYLAAFSSLLPQVLGLVGSHGIAPAATALSALRDEVGLQRDFLIAPTVFWFGISDPALLGCCTAGCLSAVVLAFSSAFARVAALICWILYLSLVSIGSPFLTFQWDALLLETGFLALFADASWLVWAYRFLLARLMFQSGAVKLLSGDVNWENLHALRYHFLTQPLPNPLAYFAYRLPAPVLDGLTGLTLAIEFVAPLLLFGPRRARHIGVFALILLQFAIIATGNYAFFNMLSLALCVWGFDDQMFARLGRLVESGRSLLHWGSQTRALARALANVMLVGYLILASAQVLLTFRVDPGRPIRSALEFAAPFEIVNGYGLFAVMTTKRPELVLQGSNDQEHWLDYSFPYKPGDLHRALPFIAPYQPRLDWQLWFAALSTYTENPWVSGLMYRILVGDPIVLGLMDRPPFPKPPRYLRALLFDYEFTTPEQRSKTGAVWTRTLQGTWFGPVSLTGR